MVDKELQGRIQEAKTNGLSNEGAKALNTIIDKYKLIFKIRLGSGGPAKFTPMKIVLDDSKNPVKVSERRYLTGQKKFFDAYFKELVGMGFHKPYLQTELQTDPHLVPKDLKSKYQTTIDSRPDNAPRKA